MNISINTSLMAFFGAGGMHEVDKKDDATRTASTIPVIEQVLD
jgi:hypothetical protein